MRTEVTVPPTLAALGFLSSGTGPLGCEFFTLRLPDGRGLEVGDETEGAGCWGANIYPDQEAFYRANKDDFTPFPGTYPTPDALVEALRKAGVVK